jgi:hypothetical protein
VTTLGEMSDDAIGERGLLVGAEGDAHRLQTTTSEPGIGAARRG